MTDPVAITRAYLQAIESGDDREAMRHFFHPEATLTELPNKLNPSGVTRDLEGILAAGERGRQVLRSQRLEPRQILVYGERVAMEVEWTGVLAVPIGNVQPGDEMRAHFAQFLEFRDGRILSIRTYDCFEPF